MPARRTHYELFGVPPDASTEEIRRAYLRLARELHPDRGPSGEQAAMQDVNEAWRVLQDAGRRAAYDRALTRATRATRGADGRADGRAAGGIDVAEPIHPATWRSAAWLVLVLLAFVAMLAITAYAGGGGSGSGDDRPSADQLVGSCIRIGTGSRVEKTPCEGPHDARVLFVADRATRCPRGTQPFDLSRDARVLCLDRS